MHAVVGLPFLQMAKGRLQVNGEANMEGLDSHEGAGLSTLLKRSKSKELNKEEELRRQREAQAIPIKAPRLPDLSSYPAIKTFGGEDRPE